jgi:hypothetical protein
MFFEKWYETLVRWIRKNYGKNPASSTGYVGPAAFEFYEKGGYLLPQFLPPKTKEWLTEISTQHSSASRLRVASLSAEEDRGPLSVGRKRFRFINTASGRRLRDVWRAMVM